VLPEVDNTNFEPVNVAKLLADVDNMEMGAEDDADLNDPALLAELHEVAHGGSRDDNDLPFLKKELADEQEAMALFEAEGEDTQDMLATINELKEKIRKIEGASQG
jgi:hypothetical protein